MNKFLYTIFIIFTLSVSSSQSQQHYSGNDVMSCNISNQTGPSSAFLYTCNHQNPTCQAFLIFRTTSLYISVSSISNLTSSDPSKLAQINNNNSILSPFPLNHEIFVPVTCSCSGQYYQANTSYISRPFDNTYFTIANDTYQGLSTCNALKMQNPYGEYDLHPGDKLQVPLRCACPTQEQIGNSAKFIMTYLVTWHDTVPNISRRFNLSARSVALANGFSDDNPKIYPFTTLLIPLPEEPSSSQTRSHIPINPSYSTVSKIKRSYNRIYIGIITGVSLAVLCFFLFYIFYYRKKRRDGEIEQGGIVQQLPKNFLEKVVDIGETLKIYTYQELEVATNNFKRRISDYVYRGILRGKLCAIKKMGTDVTNEIKILGNINHFNLVSLYGVCEHNRIFYLVYEYLEEGCLKDWLHKENSPHVTSWNHRILIALDIANGLNYLHNFTSPAYVHKDIKSCNILLNKYLRAKIGNFSLARGNGISNTTRFVGEKGYMAPEFIKFGNVTPKVDVYAFGVVLLELVTGNDVVFMRDGKEVLLSETAVSAMNGGSIGRDVNDLIDSRLQVKHPLGYIIDQGEVVLSLLKLSIACLAREPENRISIAEVVSTLMKIQSDVYSSQSFSIGEDS